MRNLFFSSLALCFAATPVCAESAKDSFTRLKSCVSTNQPGACREQITASSVEMFDRFASYGLLSCLPSDATYVSQAKTGEYTVVRASTKQLGQKPKNLRLVFAKEENDWKLDIPESLHGALGEKWEQQVTLTEQLYLALKAQLGEQMGCGAVRKLVQK